MVLIDAMVQTQDISTLTNEPFLFSHKEIGHDLSKDLTFLILGSPFLIAILRNLFTLSGVDVTVVDHNNKTVLDLLASHPSARTTEIRDLIFGRSCQVLWRHKGWALAELCGSIMTYISL